MVKWKILAWWRTSLAALFVISLAVSSWAASDKLHKVGSDKIDKKFTLENWGNKSFTAAEISADIRTGNQIVLRTRGTQNVVIWLDRNMIDWSKPISVSLNGATPNGYKAKVLQPDIELMLEQLHQPDFADKSGYADQHQMFSRKTIAHGQRFDTRHVAEQNYIATNGNIRPRCRLRRIGRRTGVFPTQILMQLWR